MRDIIFSPRQAEIFMRKAHIDPSESFAGDAKLLEQLQARAERLSADGTMAVRMHDKEIRTMGTLAKNWKGPVYQQAKAMVAAERDSPTY